MAVVWDVVLEALIDTAKMLPILLAVYFFIELLEYKRIFRFHQSSLLKGKASPIFGALFGCVPQCGFSVISTDMYTKRQISIGALIAVYIATSDETIPIMLSHPKSIISLLALIGIKLVYAIAIGSLSIWLYKLIFTRKKASKKTALLKLQESAEIDTAETDILDPESSEEAEHDEFEMSHDQHLEHNHDEDDELDGCCKHNLNETKFDWKHPLVHSLKIALFVLIANLIFGGLVQWIGEENLTAFLSSSSVWQPLFAVIIGLIPNCAASVVLTELYLFGGLSFGALVGGLCVNAGIGLLILLKNNKNIKENIFIFCILILSGIAIGYALHFIPIFVI